LEEDLDTFGVLGSITMEPQPVLDADLEDDIFFLVKKIGYLKRVLREEGA